MPSQQQVPSSPTTWAKRWAEVGSACRPWDHLLLAMPTAACLELTDPPCTVNYAASAAFSSLVGRNWELAVGLQGPLEPSSDHGAASWSTL